MGIKRGGGVIAYCKSNLDIMKIEESSICTVYVEILTLKLSMTNVKETYILGVYRPPNPDIDSGLADLERIICNLSNKSNIEVTILGDMNIDLKKNERSGNN